MSLYQKHRPQTFDDVVGNEAAVDAMRNAIENGAHVFLISGPSGCGKTTLARIAAQDLGVNDLDGMIEINTADNRGIDTARDIIETARTIPLGGGPRVFVIDEVHQTVATWQNAMLKPLEDYADDVYYFLCTTEPEKLIRPLKTRCSKISVSPLSNREIFRVLRRVHKAEGGELSTETLKNVAATANGSPRDALVLLEQVIGVEDESKINEILALGVTEEGLAATIDLCRALMSAKPNWAKVSKILTGLKGQDPEKIRRAVLGYMSAVLLKSGRVDQAAATLEMFAEPVYNTGFPGLVLATYQAMFAE